MLKVEFHSRRDSLLDAKVRSLISQIAYMWDYLDEFERVFRANIKKIQQPNAVVPAQAYQIKHVSKSKIEIWHFNLAGDPDSKIGSIQEEFVVVTID